MIKAGIVGLANTGKSTLFEVISQNRGFSADHPFATIDPNIATVEIPDEYLDKIYTKFKPQKKRYAFIEVYDIAGLVKGAHRGVGLGNKFLDNIRKVDIILHVLRFFDNNIPHVENSIDPERDCEIVELEILLKDMEHIEEWLSKNQKKAVVDKKIAKKYEAVKEAYNFLKRGFPLRYYKGIENIIGYIKDFNLLSLKPVIYVANVSELQINSNQVESTLNRIIKKFPAPFIIYPVKLELDLLELDEEERKLFIDEYNINDFPFYKKLLKLIYETTNLITFYTYNENMATAWAIERNSSIIEAARKVHSDFAEKFIKAEVVDVETLLKFESWNEIKEAGIMKVVGKDYIVNDKDVIYFKI